MGHEGHESHEQHTFTSPYPCGVAGLVKKRVVSGCARTPLFSTTAVDRLSIGRLVGEQCNFDQSSIVARMSSRAMQNGRSWVKKRNLGQKNETRAKKTGFSALFLSVSIERGGGIRKNFLGLANNSFAPHR